MSGESSGRVRIRLTQAGHAAHLVVRTLPWRAVLGAAAISVPIVLRGTRDQVPDAHLTLAAVLLAIGAGFVLDDPAEATVAGSPMPLLTRRAMRVSLLIPLLAASWIVLLAFVRPPGLSVVLTLHYTVWLAAALAAAAVASRFVPGGYAGVAAGSVLVTALVLNPVIPPRWRLLPLDPDMTSRFRAYGRPILVVIGAALVFVIASRDPAARTVVSRTRRRARPPSAAGQRSRRRGAALAR